MSDHCRAGPPLSPDLMTHFRVALLSAGAAMQRYSWTNNGLPLFSPTPLPGRKNYGILS
jgi:hypothetical protein